MVRVIGDDLGPQARTVVVHEVVHALQDQHFTLLDDRTDLDGDAEYVARAIAEGDAVLRELTYFQSLSLADQAEYFLEVSEFDLSALDSLPGYITSSLQSTYFDGFEFYQRIGLDNIDAQFIDPPESSEQLRVPASYQKDEQPRPVTMPDVEIDGYQVWFEATAGQRDIEFLLGEGLSPDDAETAALGWGGDLNRVYTKDDTNAVYVLQYVGDTKKDAEELEAAFLEYIDTLVPTDSFTLVERNADEVLVIIASDPALGPQLDAAFSLG